MGYQVVRRLARWLLGLFYGHIEVVGAERIPPAGPLILAANHQNAIVDPMILMAAVPRRLRPIAKAPLFRYPILGSLVRMAGAIPVHRRHDPGSDPAQNAAMFAAATGTLASGGVILIFPEGVSQAEPRLMPLRTGTARMALAAAAAGVTPTLLPAGLVYQEPGTFRTGRALVLVGEPVPLPDGPDLDRGAPEAAARQLTGRLETALRRLIVEARDRQALGLARAAEAIWHAEEKAPAEAGVAEGPLRTEWLRRALRAYRYLLARDPERIQAVVHSVERYARDLAGAGVTDEQLSRTYAPSVVRRYALHEGLPLLMGVPLAALGLVVHGLPYELIRLAVRLLRPEPDVEATYKILGGVVIYPLGWAVEGWLVWRLGGWLALVLFVLLLLPTGFFALTWWERLARVRREARGFLHFVLRRDLHTRLRERRRALARELAALAEEVPETVLAAEQPETPERG
jgi:1-acyl-sn-glycerol-3-phosphate acyltransferase